VVSECGKSRMQDAEWRLRCASRIGGRYPVGPADPLCRGAGNEDMMESVRAKRYSRRSYHHTFGICYRNVNGKIRLRSYCRN